MQRRDFCKAAAAVAATAVMPAPDASHAQTNAAARPALAKASDESAAADITQEASSSEYKSFNTLTEDYAAFCAKSPGQRRFYEYQDGKVVEVKLDEKTWEPSPKAGGTELPASSGMWYGVPMTSPIQGLGGDGPFQPTWDSLLQYEAPEWYQDAKFGIWAHWSPQCVPEDGDWYARYMYMEGSPISKFHRDHYGPPSKFGYKDLCPQWTLLNWEPEELISRYKKAGARLFMALANHHDGFDAWNSKHQPWNAMNIGPHQDVIGAWAAAARAQGMRFGVSVHQARNWQWMQPSHAAGKTDLAAGISYDGQLTMLDGKNQWWEGLNPQRLYSVKHPPSALPDISYVKDFYDRTRDLIDQHNPDLLYFDDHMFPLGWAGMNIGSYFYNHNLATHGQKMEAIINIKYVPDRLAKAVVADYERGITSQIMQHPWQSEICIGGWHYNRALFEQEGQYGGYMPPKNVILWMVDAVSKNGTFIMNVPGKPDGTIDSKEIAVLDGITAWMDTNGEAIYETRPWKIFGEGPVSEASGNAIAQGNKVSNAIAQGKIVSNAIVQGNNVSKLGERDIRFTRNKANTVLYALVMSWPTQPVNIRALGTSASTSPGKVQKVELLGTQEKVTWTHTPAGLRIEPPKQYHPSADYAAAFKIYLT